jgi:DNA helicase-2/ATP-dependent DNA helicase PcrA
MSSTPRIASIDEILEPLTEAQREAVCHVDGPLLILAGPGSGKTRVITHRIAYLLSQSVAARQILALTFTNKAADEMKVRLERLAPGQSVWLGTFHRFCARLLRQYADLVGLQANFSIYDTDDSRALLRDALAVSNLDLTHVTPDQIAREISNAKNNLITADLYQSLPGHALGAMAGEVYPHYQRRLLEANAVDFDDLLLHVAAMLRENTELRRMLDGRYRYILVDEYQDTNFVQYAIVRAMSQDFPHLAVTGDPDQSIYGWRGANLNSILDFEQDFPEVRVVRLEQNYRSSPDILRVADQLIGHNRRRKKKALFTDKPPGAPVRLIVYPTSQDEAEHIADQIADQIRQGKRRPRDFAIFYRVNAISRGMESALRAHAIPYQVVRGLEFYQRKEIKDVLAYLHLINNPQNDVALSRIINMPPRRIGKTTIQRLVDHARQKRLCLLDAAREAGLIEAVNKRAATNVAAFVAMYDRLSLFATAPLEEVIGQVLNETGYAKWLKDLDTEEDRERLANTEELLSDAREFDNQHPEDAQLETFLEQSSLVSDLDDWETETDRVSLMTLHAAKGLEFAWVFIVAIEQRFLPHERSKDDPEKLEEERRLFFVGITRAEEELQLSNARYRFVQGSQRMTIPSQFLLELPRDEMEIVLPPGMRGLSESTQVESDDTQWDQSWDESPESWDADDATMHEADTKSGVAGADPQSGDRSDPTSAAHPESAAGLPRMLTAAEMLNGVDATDGATSVSPDAFHPGMVVKHPKHGLGKIVALSGNGEKRSASVQFFDSPRQRKFVLIHSDLQPVRSQRP